ncbi:MAG: helix-turn-helix transcriptional regulator, partial [Planctomycetota bacterium]
MNNFNNNNDLSKAVCDRLLDAAEQLFAQTGFNGTSIRHITTKANSNIAAVNYHFGGKEKLYIEVF